MYNNAPAPIMNHHKATWTLRRSQFGSTQNWNLNNENPIDPERIYRRRVEQPPSSCAIWLWVRMSHFVLSVHVIKYWITTTKNTLPLSNWSYILIYPTTCGNDSKHILFLLWTAAKQQLFPTSRALRARSSCGVATRHRCFWKVVIHHCCC